MPTDQAHVPVDVQTDWIDFSPALRHYASERVGSALAHYAPQIRAVTVRISGGDPQRPAQRRCDVHVATEDRPISASATGVDLFALVDQSAEAIVRMLRERSSGERATDLRQQIA